MYYYASSTRNDWWDYQYLKHHGIQGMKWGVKNGPPYPLDSGGKDRHSSSERRAGSSSEGDSGSHKLPSSILDPLPVVPISAFVALKIADAVSLKKRKKEQEKLRNERSSAPIDKKTGFHLKTQELSEAEDMRRVNLGYNPNDRGTGMNCVNCTLSYELRRRGYDVEAKEISSGRVGKEVAKECFKNSKNVDVSWPNDNIRNREDFVSITKWYKEAEKKSNRKELAKKTIQEMSKEPDSRGQILVRWGLSAGHSMAYEVKNGELIIRDCQISEEYRGKAVEKLLSKACAVSYQRYDNCKMNAKELKKGVR